VLGELDVVFLELDHPILNIDILLLLQHFDYVLGPYHFVQIALESSGLTVLNFLPILIPLLRAAHWSLGRGRLSVQ